MALQQRRQTLLDLHDLNPEDLLREKFQTLEYYEELICKMIFQLGEYVKLIEHFQNLNTGDNRMKFQYVTQSDFAYYEPELYNDWLKRRYKHKCPIRIMSLQCQIQFSLSQWTRCLTLVGNELHRRRQLWTRKSLSVS